MKEEKAKGKTAQIRAHAHKYGFARIALLILLIAPLLSLSTNARSDTNPVQAYCSQVIQTPSPINENVVLDIIPILLSMTAVIALAYLFGYTFRIDRLLRFSKTELGELIVTGIVVAVFVGGILSVSNPASFTNTFNTDCQQLYTNFFIMLGEFRGLILSQFVLSFISSTSFSITHNYWGIQSAQPLAGLSFISTVVIAALVNIAFAFTGVQLAITFLLGIFFALLPLFFYAGIILRTFPWTRAIGGAFLGLFLAFYVAFPALLSLMLISYCPANPNPGYQGSCLAPALGSSNYIGGHLSKAPTGNIGVVSSIGNFESYFSGWDLSPILLQFASSVSDVIAPSLSNIIAILIAFLISYDLMEALGDLLGSPSLSSSRTLSKLL